MDVDEAYENTVHCFRLSMKILKFVTYIVLHIGVLLSALVSKGALLLMTNSVSHVQQVNRTLIWLSRTRIVRFEFFFSGAVPRTLGLDAFSDCLRSLRLFVFREFWKIFVQQQAMADTENFHDRSFNRKLSKIFSKKNRRKLFLFFSRFFLLKLCTVLVSPFSFFKFYRNSTPLEVSW